MGQELANKVTVGTKTRKPFRKTQSQIHSAESDMESELDTQEEEEEEDAQSDDSSAHSSVSIGTFANALQKKPPFKKRFAKRL